MQISPVTVPSKKQLSTLKIRVKGTWLHIIWGACIRFWLTCPFVCVQNLGASIPAYMLRPVSLCRVLAMLWGIYNSKKNQRINTSGSELCSSQNALFWGAMIWWRFWGHLSLSTTTITRGVWIRGLNPDSLTRCGHINHCADGNLRSMKKIYFLNFYPRIFPILLPPDKYVRSTPPWYVHVPTG